MQRLTPGRRLWSRIALYFASLIVLMAVISIASYWHTRSAAIEDARVQMANNLSFSISTLDDTLWQVQSVCVSVFQDESLKRIQEEIRGGSMSSAAYAIIRGRLSTAQNLLSTKTRNLFYFFDDRSVFTGSGTRTQMDWYCEKAHVYDDYGVDFLKGLLQETSALSFLLPTNVHISGGFLGEVIPAVLTDPSPGFNAVIVADIPLSLFYKTLYANTYSEGSDYCIWDAQGQLIYESWEGLGALLQGVPEGIVRVDGVPSVVIFNTESLYAWTYAQMAPIAAISEGVKSRLLEILILGVVALSFALLLMLYATNKLYSPMKLMLDISQGNREWHGNALTSLEKDLAEFAQTRSSEQQTADRFAQAYLDYSFRSMLNGYAVHEEDLFFQQMSASVQFQSGAFLCCVIRCTLMADFFARAQEDQHLHAFSRMLTILQNLYRARSGAHVLELSDGQYFLFWGMQEADAQEALSRSFEELRALFYRDARYMHIHIGVGTRKDRLDALPESYAEALAALVQCPTEEGFCIRQANDNTWHAAAWAQESISALTDAAENLREEDAQLLAYQMLLRSPKDARQTALHIHHALQAMLTRRGVNADALTDPSQTTDHLVCQKEVAVIVRQCLALMRNATASNTSSDVVARAVEYIHGHFSQELSIESIAYALSVPARSLSALFREALGMTVIEYLHQARIDYVKGALVHTDKRIADIAAEAGLASRSTFARTFKRYVGMAPREYRDLYQNTTEVNRKRGDSP